MEKDASGTIESLLAAVTQVSTLAGEKHLSNASGFFE